MGITTNNAKDNISAAKFSSSTSDIPIVKPNTPSFDTISNQIKEILSTGMLTNSRFVREFENQIADFLGVEEAVAVSSCTTGLIMTLKVLQITGEILVPSFTFSASGHACYWAGLEPAFVDCDRRDWTISLQDCTNMTTSRTRAILAVHTFGNPADIYALQEFAASHELELLFDSAHGFGSICRGKRVGFGGHAEVFSLTPTKIITSGEGGIISTNDSHLARELRIFRNYGDDGSYDCRFIGLNGRMPEFNAILGLAALSNAEEEIRIRNTIADLYRNELEGVPGIEFQKIYPENRSSYKDFTIVINENEFGGGRDQLSEFLSSRGIQSKKYFHPPLHMQSAYKAKRFRSSGLQNTNYICKRTLSLPMHSHMKKEDVNRVCNLIKEFHEKAAAAKSEVRPSRPSGREMSTTH